MKYGVQLKYQVITAAFLYNCMFNNTTNLYIRNNTLFDNSTFNTATIYAQGIPNSGFVTCTIENSKVTDLSLNQTSWSCVINYVIDNCEITNTNKQLLYLRALGNETNADNTIKKSTLKFIKQSTTTLNPIYLINNFGVLNIEGNNIAVEGNSYLISGDSITSGDNIINYSNNTLSQVVSILNSKYNNNTMIKLNTL